MFAETGAQQPGDKFLMQTGPFKTEHPLCFTFWYYMYGTAMGTLQLKDNNIVLISYSGNQGKRWRKAAVSLGSGSHLVR